MSVYAGLNGGGDGEAGFNTRLAVTFFDDYGAASRREEIYTLAALASRINTVTARKKKGLPWLKCARFGDIRTDKNSLRHDANMLAISGIEADYDAELMTLDEAVEILTKAGMKAIVYTSPSHTDAKPRWRVLCPLSAEYPPDRRADFMGRLNGQFQGVFSAESWTLSQSYYFGSVQSNPAHRVELIDGTPIDQMDELDKIWLGKPNTETRTGTDRKPRTGPMDEAALLAEMATGTSYHANAVRLLGRWARDGMPFMDARTRLIGAMEAVFPPDRDERWHARRADVDRCLENIYGKEAKAKDEGAAKTPDPSPADAEALDGFALNEDGIALAFAKIHQDRLRYDHTRGAWFQWTGKAWRQDETKLAFSWARRICRQIAKQAAGEGKPLASLAKAATAAAVERFAQSDPVLAVTSTIWDRDPFLLGTPGGTLDLHTGELREATPEDHITKLTAVAPALAPNCPMWLAFLDQATNGDAGLIRFLRQWCGYCLTGDTREHALLFGYGSGGNGKGVFLNTVSRTMGDYARNAAMDTFTASTTDRHPADLAMLRGARLVTASETEEGRAWAEARIKALTGGDTITARFMRQDFFEYVPHFKLTIIGNHKPVLKNVDDAAKRRFNMAPFIHKPAKPDRQREHKLKAEWPEILRWMIEGCLDWQMHGLVRPDVVKNTTAEYFSEQDIVNQWVTEFCTLGATQSDTLETLFKSWTAYAVANGEKPGTSKWFSQTLARLGCEAVKNTPMNHGKRGFKGIAVTPVAKTSHHEPPADRE